MASAHYVTQRSIAACAGAQVAMHLALGNRNLWHGAVNQNPTTEFGTDGFTSKRPARHLGDLPT